MHAKLGCMTDLHLVLFARAATGDEVVVMNEQGYGRMVVLDRTLNFPDALRWQFTGDNEQPPTAAMVQACWEYTRRSQFPNAQIKASTLDEFGQLLWERRDLLPVVSQEIGNAWLPQMNTDPWRLRAVRAISRLRTAWLAAGKIEADDVALQGYQSRLLIPLEHNFGMYVEKVINSTAHTTCWTNACFHAAMKAGGGAGSKGCATFGGVCTGYDGLAQFARERNSFLWPLPATKRSGGGNAQYAAFAADVNRTLEQLAIVPSLLERTKTGLTEIADIHAPGALRLETAGLQLVFDNATGAVISLVVGKTTGGRGALGGREWAGAANRLGEFVCEWQQQLVDLFLTPSSLFDLIR